MKNKNIKIKVDKYEFSLILTALNDYRTQKIKDGESTDFVNEVLIKLVG